MIARMLESVALNPVTVKELRQLVRSRFMVVVLVLFLTVLLFTIGVQLIGRTVQTLAGRPEDLGAGRALFLYLLPILNAACLLFVPAYVGIRLAAERAGNNMDLMFITTITPQMIVRGKFFSGLVITGLLFSVSMPFMAFMYLLRGIDLPSIFVSLGFSFLVNAAAIQFAIFLASIRVSVAFKAILGLGGLGALFSLVMSSSLMAAFYFDSGAGVGAGTGEFWAIAGTVAALLIVFVAVFQVLSVALLMPAAANRALPVRVALTGAWLIGGVIALVWALVKHEPQIVVVWAAPALVILAIAAVMAVSERDALNFRIRRAIPSNRALRLLAFPFFTGATSALTWVALISALTLGVAMAGVHLGGQSGVDTRDCLEVLQRMRLLLLYACCYALTGALIRRTLLRNLVPAAATWLVALLLLAAGCLMPVLVGFFLKKVTADSLGAWQLGNIFAAFGDEAYFSSHFHLAAAWAAAATVLNFRWLLKQAREFVPAPPTPPDPAEGSASNP